MIDGYELFSNSPKIQIGIVLEKYTIAGILSPTVFRKIYRNWKYVVKQGKITYGKYYGSEPMIIVIPHKPTKVLTMEQCKLHNPNATEQEIKELFDSLKLEDCLLLPHSEVLKDIEEYTNKIEEVDPYLQTK